MARRGVKTKEGELLDDENIEKVVSLLERNKDPITKKEACRLLNISYNTTRLGTIIENHKERQEQIKRIKAKKRGTSATPIEISTIIKDYLSGESIAELAKQSYRSTLFVKGILKKYSVPERAKATDYFKPELIPDDALSEDYEAGEICWSARYNTLAQIVGHKAKDPKFSKWNNKGLIQIHPEYGNVYRIWLFGSHCRYAAQPWYELGKLEHLEELGVKLNEKGSFI